MLAFVLRALSRPITEVFAGAALPRAVAEWSTRGQLKAKKRTAQVIGVEPDRWPTGASAREETEWLNRVFPLDDAETRPTLFGNVMATAAEHPRLAYMMEGLLWWPRLAPLVPGSFYDMIGGAQAPTMALLNLSVVLTALALGGALTLALSGAHGIAAVVVLVGGLFLGRLSYRAAVSQASELGSLIRVGFDLYRHEILRQMDLDIPADLEAERALWNRLTAQVLGLQAPAYAEQVAQETPTSATSAGTPQADPPS
jgi:hypothetical protein